MRPLPPARVRLTGQDQWRSRRSKTTRVSLAEPEGPPWSGSGPRSARGIRSPSSAHSSRSTSRTASIAASVRRSPSISSACRCSPSPAIESSASSTRSSASSRRTARTPTRPSSASLWALARLRFSRNSPIHRQLSQAVGADCSDARYPEPGDRFAKYHLRSVLGIGGAARVYLATEDELGGRRVALKISASIGREPSILANLDHRNIVPILTVTEPEEGLRGFCMPYRPGVTLEKLISVSGRRPCPDPPRPSGRRSSPPTRRRSRASRMTGPAGRLPAIGHLSRGDRLDRAVAGQRAGLPACPRRAPSRHQAGQRPAGVSRRAATPRLQPRPCPERSGHAKAALKGGTLPYMAPEQLRAFLDPADWEKVGAPADLYALGLVLRGLLTGQPPEVPNPRLPLARKRSRRSTIAAPSPWFPSADSTPASRPPSNRSSRSAWNSTPRRGISRPRSSPRISDASWAESP